MTRENTYFIVPLMLLSLFVHKGFGAETGSEQPAQTIPVQAKNLSSPVLSLEQCVSLALENNPALQMEREKITELENDYRILSSALYPRLSLSAYVMQLDTDRIITSNGMVYSEERLAQLKAKQILFDGGKTRYGSGAAARAAEAQRESTEAARLDTISTVSQAYYRVLEARELIRVGENSREQRKAFSNLTESFFNAGRATRLESLRAEAQLLDAERTLIQAREAARLSELILKKIVGLDLQKEFEIADSLPETLAEPGSEDVLLQEALSNSPDIRKTDLIKQQSLDSLRSSYGSYFPEISLQGTYGYRERDATGADEWTAGVFLEWSLFEGGFTRAQVGKARARSNQAAWNERAVIDQVQVNLRESLGNMRTALAAVKASKLLVEAQDEAYKATVMFYKQGKSTYIEVLSAQTDLTQAKAGYVRAVGDYQNASARLDRVVGIKNKS